MIIGICGYGYTGSGAVLDLLREYNGLTQTDYDVELMITYYPDGLINLEKSLFEKSSRFMEADVALYRFEKWINQYSRSSGSLKKCTKGTLPILSKQFMDDITDIEWEGNWMFDFYQHQDTNIGWFISRVIRLIQNEFDKRNINIQLIKNRHMRMSMNQEKFNIAAKKFIRSIIKAMYPNAKKKIVLNQPFSADKPTESFKYFDDPVAVVVDRDPRDVYILAKKATKNKSAWIPTDDVEKFIEYYKFLHRNVEEEKKTGKVLYIQFEDLVYNTEKTIKYLEEFLGEIGGKSRKRYFFPEKSINNTQLFKVYKEYSKDIIKIENELSEYLYDFSGMEEPNRNSEVF